VADPAGTLATAMWDSTATGWPLSTAGAWLAAFAFAIQIYFDFSAYTDMAIGLARVFGFHFPENFAAPYSSISATEFWRRWHMTLSRWFRDYV
jgi:alginate O-acetyltransferase complex protein AlgI